MFLAFIILVSWRIFYGQHNSTIMNLYIYNFQKTLSIKSYNSDICICKGMESVTFFNFMYFQFFFSNEIQILLFRHMIYKKKPAHSISISAIRLALRARADTTSRANPGLRSYRVWYFIFDDISTHYWPNYHSICQNSRISTPSTTHF